jgi:hypothetical protein
LRRDVHDDAFRPVPVVSRRGGADEGTVAAMRADGVVTDGFPAGGRSRKRFGGTNGPSSAGATSVGTWMRSTMRMAIDR